MNEYFDFLWQQFQYDWSVFTNPWILYPVIPAILYFIFFWCKWWILLVPITLPVSMLSKAIASTSASIDDKEVDKVREKLSKVLKGN